MKRGDIVTAVLPREHGKPRPALIVQSDELQGSTTVLVCPMTTGTEFNAPHRMQIEPSATNGLRDISLVMTDKLQANLRDRCGSVIGRLTERQMATVDASLAYILGIRLP